MPENQAHGKAWETELGLHVYGATADELKTVPHTAPIDIPKRFNRLSGVDISVKVSGKDVIDMGDIVRIYEETSRDEPIHMTLVEYEQNTPTTKKLRRITEVDLTHSAHLLFGTVTHAQLQELVATTKAVGRVRPSVSSEARSSQIAAAYAMRDALHASTGYIHFHLMFYTNNSSRVQGQFKEFAKFLQENPERIIATSASCEFRGGYVAEELLSTRRPRRKRLEPDSAPHSLPTLTSS